MLCLRRLVSIELPPRRAGQRARSTLAQRNARWNATSGRVGKTDAPAAANFQCVPHPASNHSAPSADWLTSSCRARSTLAQRNARWNATSERVGKTNAALPPNRLHRHQVPVRQFLNLSYLLLTTATYVNHVFHPPTKGGKRISLYPALLATP
jgi:hypothetical protein